MNCVVGIGTDIVRVDRLAALWEEYGARFAQRVLGPQELVEFAGARHPGRFLAKRFAAKEAAAKALGIGFRDGVWLTQIQVTHDAVGRPGLALHGRAAEVLAAVGADAAQLTLSDERDYAVAFVVLTRG